MKKCPKCNCCRKNKAEVKDFRTDHETGITSSYRVCRCCFTLSDVDFFRFLREENPDIPEELING